LEAVDLGSFKSALRRDYRAARKQFAQESGATVREALSQNMLRVIRDLADEGTQITVYEPFREEASFNLPLTGQYFFPVVEDEQMNFFTTSRIALDPHKPILTFTPAVAADQFGTRLGLGKGYYDRFFSQFPQALRVAVIFQIQFSKDPLPVDSWDQPLDWIVTESMILRTSTRSP
jgi:5,10-methenyltetrahydrofolate synthetase